MNDIKKLSACLLLEIHNVIDESNGFMAFDLIKLAEKYNTSKAIVQETFNYLVNQDQIDLFTVRDDKRKVGVIYKKDPRRKNLLKYYEELSK